MERSLVYLRELDPVRTYYADMLRIKEHVRRNHCNEASASSSPRTTTPRSPSRVV